MKKTERGIALIEAMVACIILAIGLIGTLGLQARAQSVLMSADQRAEAAIAGEKLVGIMSNDQGANQSNLSAYAMTAGGGVPLALAGWHADTVKMMPGATVSVTVTLDSPGLTRVDLLITWVRKSQDKPDTHRLTSYIAAS